MRVWKVISWVVWSLAPCPAAAQLPSAEEFHAAIAAAQPQARALGLTLRTDALWLRAVQLRAPMVAALRGGECHIGYTGFTPRADFGWMFPALPAEQRAAWIAGVIHHELAHCADWQERGRGAEAVATGHGSRRSREVLADLAFALHVTQQLPQGRQLVARLVAIRAARSAEDPGHDTSSALRCFLSEPKATPAVAGWLATLRFWQARCSDGDAMSDPARVETASGLNSR